MFRGGTCFHKLRISPARRYSEDLDYVRVSAGGIQPLTSALTAPGRALGFDVRTRVTEHPKFFFRTPAADGAQLRIKVEVDTRERAPIEPLEGVQFAVDSPYWSGSATVQTFSTSELVATKIRALYQRKKGRDLFDLWLALSSLGLAGDQLGTTFGPYRPEGMTVGRAEENLRAKLADEGFRTDLEPLVGSWPAGYDIDEAGELLVTEVLRKL